MTKRIISLLLAVLMFAALPIAGAFADKETVEYTIGTETMKDICNNNGLDYEFCKAAIIQLNSAFTKEEDFQNIHVNDKIFASLTAMTGYSFSISFLKVLVGAM